MECAGTRLNRKQGRVIERYQYADYTERNQQRVRKNKKYYFRRQAIVEHPFGTIKRQWRYTFTSCLDVPKNANVYGGTVEAYNP